MNGFPFDIVGFDLDGTLVDSLGDLGDAVNHVLAGLDRPALMPNDIRAMIGGGSARLMHKALAATGGCPDGAFDRLHAAMLDHYAEHIAVRTRPFDGAVAALDELAARGAVLAVVTNKPARLAQALLEALGLRGRFACLIGGDTLGEGLAKPDRAPIDEMVARCGGGRAAFVGDSVYDVQAAAAAGIPCVVVAFGFAASPVETLGADAVIDSYDALIPALVRLAGDAAAG